MKCPHCNAELPGAYLPEKCPHCGREALFEIGSEHAGEKPRITTTGGRSALKTAIWIFVCVVGGILLLLAILFAGCLLMLGNSGIH